MRRDSLHPHALFSLKPMNGRAEEVLKHPDNARFVSTFRPYEDNPTVEVEGLEVGFHIRSASRYTLATIGREGDIVVNNPGISRMHCSFELHENKEEIMLQDRSQNRSTSLLGVTKMPFEPGRPHRRVIVDQNINREFGFGGAAGDLYQFKIFWHKYDKSMVFQQINHREDNPRQARTIADEPLAIVPSLPSTRIHAAGSPERIRYSRREELGKGTFGVVWKVANVDTGAQLAVKRITTWGDSDRNLLLKREVDMLSRVSHLHIIKCITSQTTDDGHFEIFMELKFGSVEYLIDKRHLFETNPAPVRSLLFQMLLALNCLANKGMIHRDVKPENILFTPLSGERYLYQLADFGVANLAVDAQTYAGTKSYMAPEVYPGSTEPQTVKMDIWSLFVTAAYATDAAGYQRKPRRRREQVFRAVTEAANSAWLQQFRDMAIENPEYRATAGDMLKKVWVPTTSQN